MATTQKTANPAPEQERTALRCNAAVEFGREVCGSLELADEREWLVTNGIGGYASGTVSGDLTRRYHGLLVAALHTPVGRTQLVAKLEETAGYEGGAFALATTRWSSGAVEPKGYLNIESFRLESTIPVWRFALADALLEKRIWMRQGENPTHVQYSLLRGNGPLHLAVKALVNYRDFHSSTHAGDCLMRVESVGQGIRITAFDGATPFWLLSANARFEPRHEWYRDFLLPEETARGLDDREDYLFAAANVELGRSQSVTHRRRRLVSSQSAFCRVVAGESYFSGAAKSHCGCSRAPLAYLARPPQSRARRAWLPGALWWWSARARRRLPSGNRVGLAIGTLCTGALAHLRRPPSGAKLPRTARKADFILRLGDSWRNFRWGRSFHTARMHCPGLDRCGSAQGLARDRRLS